MRRQLHAAVSHRRRRVLLGRAPLSESQSTFTAAAFRWDGDGVDTNALTFTARDENGVAMPGVAWTAVIEQVAVGAAESSVVAAPEEIADDGAASASCLLYLRDDDGYPMASVPAALCVLAVSGAGNTVTQPASATSATGQTGGSFVSTTAATKTVSYTALTQAITETDTVVVSAAPSAPTLAFHSRWDFATGSSGNAMSDNDAFTGPNAEFGAGTGGAVVETLASLALTEPAELSTVANALVTRATALGYGQTANTEYDAGLPADTDVWAYRIYMACLQPDATGDGQKGHVEHGYESANTGGGDGWNFMRIPKSDGTWRLVFRDITSGYRFVAWNLALDKDAWYRVEHRLTYGAATYTLEVRITDPDGVLVGTDADFWQYVPSENTGILLSGFAIAYTAANHRYIRIGNNGPSSNYPGVGGVGTPPSLGDGMHATTGFAVCKTGDWCGAYDASNEP